MIIPTFFAKTYHDKEENIIGTVMPVIQEDWLHEDWDEVDETWNVYLSTHSKIGIEEFVYIWNSGNDKHLAFVSIDFYQPI